MVRNTLWVFRVRGLLALVLGFCSCSKSVPLIQDHEIWNEEFPFVEAYIEYLGPEEVWGGPQDYTIHITADKRFQHRLADLSVAMRDAEPDFKGCLTPLRVKLIREDGNSIERQSCRRLEGWPKLASEIVNDFLEASSNQATKPVEEKKQPIQVNSTLIH